MMTFDFPVGYHDLHKTKIIDFQLNRWHSLGYCRLSDMAEAAAEIRDLTDMKPAMVRQAEKALAEGRLMNGAFHIRAAEFFVHQDDPDKLALYDRFLDLFYNELMVDEPIERARVPYGDVYLPAMRVPALGEATQGTIVIHGGFDSLIEEFYSWATFFARAGYDVVAFEGPGQGGPLRYDGLPMDYRWERPAAAVLDYFGLNDVTWLGISMGGWLCFRAAALEPRIGRVIASSVAYDYMKIPPPPVEAFARWLLKYPGLMRPMAEMKMKLMPQENWGAVNLMYIMQRDDMIEASIDFLNFNAENLLSDRVTQDVLILTGAEDHFIPMKIHDLQVAALTNSRSVTPRVFTRAEQAHNHCQVGNIGLALETMLAWLREIAGVRQPAKAAAGKPEPSLPVA
jgi:pimeloyl-ACP methyl ester carboxylesterase